MTPRAIPLPGDPRAPKYWRDETTGVLASAIWMFLNDPARLTPGMIAYIRAYLKQWIDSPVWEMNPGADREQLVALARLRQGVNVIANEEDIRGWLWAALNEGIDPL